jgi:endonuclease III
MTEQRGIAKGKAEVVKNLIIKLGLDDAKAADIADVSIEFVQQVRADLASDAKN